MTDMNIMVQIIGNIYKLVKAKLKRQSNAYTENKQTMQWVKTIGLFSKSVNINSASKITYTLALLKAPYIIQHRQRVDTIA